MHALKITTAAAFIFSIGMNAAMGQGYNKSKFHQLDELWPAANDCHSGDGAPGAKYWQQRADYDIKVALDEEKRSLTGAETVVYHNNSPHALTYLWLQLDQNIFAPNSMTYSTETREKMEDMSFEAYQTFTRQQFDGGYKIKSVKDLAGKDLPHTINYTMMRIDLPKTLLPGESFSFKIDWFNFINNCKTHGGRGGYEYFEKEDNCIFEMAQWYPRMCVYDDVDGWQNKQYLGRGEFALEFGDFHVEITAPADYAVTATGELRNASAVLTNVQIERFAKAKNATKPMYIITPEEALNKEKQHDKNKKTWIFEAKNVRDFAWAGSRKFLWDAMGTQVGDKKIMAMSFFPKEGNPLWERYSTETIAHTLKSYSKHTVDYAYPVAISVNGPVGGMEYPMICFNGPRPMPDSTYSAETKHSLISVVIHEVGHNFFPMIINSDERQWSWMDEGFNTFCEYLAEQEWEEKYPSRRGEPADIVRYMSSDPATLEPIMTNSESIIQFGPNVYGKTATALNILRETVMGRELFDYSFKKYAERWAYKHPKPSDFFRTMEDASGVDLDWFWRGWFYGIEPVDIALNNVTHYVYDTQNPDVEQVSRKAKHDKEFANTISEIKNKESIKQYLIEKNPDLQDFYNKYNSLDVTENDRKKYQEYLNSLSGAEKQILANGLHFYILDLENVGGLISPVIVNMQFADGTEKTERIPAEIWRLNNKKVNKLLITEKEVKQFQLDPLRETADINTKNNYFSQNIIEAQFKLTKPQKPAPQANPMQLNKMGK